jgi:hypothetical protein
VHRRKSASTITGNQHLIVNGKGEQLWKAEVDFQGKFYVFYNYADKELFYDVQQF